MGLHLKSFFVGSTSPRCKKLAAWTVAGFLFYTVFGFFLLPPITRAVAVKQLSKHLDRTVTIEQVRLNPYMLSATIRGLLIQDKDNVPLVSWTEVYVNFQISSLIRQPWIFKEVKLSQPFVRLQVNKDYSLNLSDLVDRFSPAVTSKSGKTGMPRRWRIDRLHLSGGTVSFTDLTTRIPFQRTVGPLQVTVTRFQTGSDHKNSFALSGVSVGGERFSWKGFFYLAPLRSEGEFSLDGFALTTYAPFYQDLFRFGVKDGVLSLHSNYRYETSPATNLLALTNTTFGLKSLSVVEKATGQAVVGVSNFVVTGASLDAMTRQGEADTMTVTGGRFALRRNRDTSVNALELFKPADSAPATPGGILLLLRAMTNLVALLINTTNLSNGIIRELNLTHCALHLEDLANSKPVWLNLEDIAVHGKNISNRAGTNMTATGALRWDTNGAVRANIRAALSPPNAEVELELDKLNLLPLTPYLEPYLNVLVLGSKLGMAGTIRLRSANDALPEVRFQGDVWLDDFSTAEGNAAEGLLQWNLFRLSGIEANLNPPVVSVAKATLEDVFARLIIETNRTFNLISALHRGGTDGTAARQVTNVAARLRPKISLASGVLSNANLHFIDRSLRPNVNISLEQLSGTVSGLSSDDLQRADVHLQGTVDKSAPAEITGKIDPWSSKQPMDLTLSLKEMDLLPGDPYSGKYLGYRLERGRLSAQLTYQITERELKSANHLVIDQLTLGQKVESPDATKLPVRLVIALLKDRHGRITLEVPVNGNLDDPQFNLGEVVYGAIRTVLTRIVTSPFSALGALLGGNSEELSFQDFEAGSTNLLPTALAKLDLLAQGLYARPELQLEIQGSTEPLADLKALRLEKLNKHSLAQKWSPAPNLLPGETNAAATEGASARSRSKNSSLEKGASALRSPVPYRSTTTSDFTRTKKDSTSALSASAGEKGASALMQTFAPLGAVVDADGEHDLLEAVEVAPNSLRTLAEERARNVKAYLLQTGKVEPQRITESSQGNTSKGSRVYLWLQ